MILMINYDLNKSGQNYTGLVREIKSLGSCVQPCESCYLVATTRSVSSVYDALKRHIDSNDSLLVSRFDASSYKGWLSKEVISWINRNSISSIYSQY